LELGDAAIAFAHFQAAFDLQPADESVQRRLLQSALELQRLPAARALIDRIHPDPGSRAAPGLRRAQALAAVAARTGDPAALRNASDAAAADELLLLRTVGADGATYVPVRVQNGFTMPHLEPGAFVEWRYRRFGRSPGAGPLQLEEFVFASLQEPLHLTELVLLLPPQPRGELRARNLPAKAKEQPLADGRRALVLTASNVARPPEEGSPPTAEELLPSAAWGEDAPPWPLLRQTRAQLL